MAKVIHLPTTQAPAEQPKERFSRRKDGLYQLELRYTLPDGSKKKKSFYGKTQAEAIEKRKAFERDVEAGIQVDRQNTTVKSWSDEWLGVYKANVTDNTREQYQITLNRINAQIGTRKLTSITPSDTQKVMNSLSGMSGSTIDKTAMILRSLFARAVSERLLLHNPCDNLIKPEAKHGTHRAIESEMQELILKSWRGHRFGRAAMLMLFAGLRRGEALALESGDVSDAIRVTKSLRFNKNDPAIAPPKTRAGIRSIPIMPQLHDVVRDYVGLYASMKTGSHMSKSSFRKAWDSYVKYLSRVAGREIDLRCHDLRHTFCTSLFDAGVSVKTAQRWMGHSDVTITMRIYTHLSSMREDADTNLAKRFFKTMSVNMSVKSRQRTRKSL